jgi:predicted SnoaL-like aldol condensation-catalyzing enzyme
MMNNKAFVRDYAAAERFWSPEYIQHSAHIEQGREGLQSHQESSADLEGDYVLLHGRFSAIGLPTNWIVVDVVRLEDGNLKEHWDVVEDEASQASSRSGLPMFGSTFP